MVQRTYFGEQKDVELELALAGFANGAQSIDALEAMVALLRIVSPQFARVRF